jgi:Flp pilus assembly protein TadD
MQTKRPNEMRRGLSATAIALLLALGVSGCGTDKLTTGSIGRSRGQPVETMSSGDLHNAAIALGQTYAKNPDDKSIAIKYATATRTSRWR